MNPNEQLPGMPYVPEPRAAKPAKVKDGLAVVLMKPHAHYGLLMGGERAAIPLEEALAEMERPKTEQRFTIVEQGAPKKGDDVLVQRLGKRGPAYARAVGRV